MINADNVSHIQLWALAGFVGKCNFAYVELTLIIDHKKNSFLYFSFEKSRIFAELIYIKSI